MIVHDLSPDAVGRMPQVDLSALGREPDSPIGTFTFHRCIGGVAAFKGRPPWEHHTGGDELLYVLDGESDLTVLEGDVADTRTITRGQLVIVPQDSWHSNDSRDGVTFLYLTPRDGNEHSWEDPRS